MTELYAAISETEECLFGRMKSTAYMETRFKDLLPDMPALNAMRNMPIASAMRHDTK